MERVKVALLIILGATLSLSTPKMLRADKAEKSYKRGVKFRDKGDLERAKHEFEEAVRGRGDYAEARTFLALTHSELGGQTKGQGDLDRASAEYQEALRLEPDDAYWHRDLAVILSNKGDYDGAAKECAEAARLSPYDEGLADECGLRAKGDSKSQGSPGQEAKQGNESNPFRVAGEVAAPIPTFKPEPPYSERARRVRYQGTTVLYMVVDAQGNVVQTRVVKVLGLGLDQNALQTVRTWKFRPAMRHGQPVAVRVMVEIVFRLH